MANRSIIEHLVQFKLAGVRSVVAGYKQIANATNSLDKSTSKAATSLSVALNKAGVVDVRSLDDFNASLARSKQFFIETATVSQASFKSTAAAIRRTDKDLVSTNSSLSSNKQRRDALNTSINDNRQALTVWQNTLKAGVGDQNIAQSKVSELNKVLYNQTNQRDALNKKIDAEKAKVNDLNNRRQVLINQANNIVSSKKQEITATDQLQSSLAAQSRVSAIAAKGNQAGAAALAALGNESQQYGVTLKSLNNALSKGAITKEQYNKVFKSTTEKKLRSELKALDIQEKTSGQNLDTLASRREKLNKLKEIGSILSLREEKSLNLTNRQLSKSVIAENSLRTSLKSLNTEYQNVSKFGGTYSDKIGLIDKKHKLLRQAVSSGVNIQEKFGTSLDEVSRQKADIKLSALRKEQTALGKSIPSKELRIYQELARDGIKLDDQQKRRVAELEKAIDSQATARRKNIGSLVKWAVGWTLAYSALRTATRIITGTVKALFLLEDSMARVATVTRPVGEDLASAMRRTKDAILDVGRTSTIPLAQVATSMYQLRSAGLSVDDSIAALETTVKLTEATMGDIGQTTKLVAGIYNLYGKSISDAATTTERFRKIANLIAVTYTEQQVELTEIASAFQLVGAASSIMNIRLETLIGTIGFLNSSMLKGTRAGTSLLNAFIKIAQNSDKLKTEFGLAFDPSLPLDFTGTIEQLNVALGGAVSDADTMNKLIKVFGLRGARSVAAVLKNYDRWKEAINVTKRTSEDFLDDIKTRFEATLPRAIKRFSNTFQALMEQNVGIFGKLSEAADKFNRKLDEAAELDKLKRSAQLIQDTLDIDNTTAAQRAASGLTKSYVEAAKLIKKNLIDAVLAPKDVADAIFPESQASQFYKEQIRLAKELSAAGVSEVSQQEAIFAIKRTSVRENISLLDAIKKVSVTEDGRLKIGKEIVKQLIVETDLEEQKLRLKSAVLNSTKLAVFEAQRNADAIVRQVKETGKLQQAQQEFRDAVDRVIIARQKELDLSKLNVSIRSALTDQAKKAVKEEGKHSDVLKKAEALATRIEKAYGRTTGEILEGVRNQGLLNDITSEDLQIALQTVLSKAELNKLLKLGLAIEAQRKALAEDINKSYTEELIKRAQSNEFLSKQEQINLRIASIINKTADGAERQKQIFEEMLDIQTEMTEEVNSLARGFGDSLNDAIISGIDEMKTFGDVANDIFFSIGETIRKKYVEAITDPIIEKSLTNLAQGVQSQTVGTLEGGGGIVAQEQMISNIVNAHASGGEIAGDIIAGKMAGVSVEVGDKIASAIAPSGGADPISKSGAKAGTSFGFKASSLLAKTSPLFGTIIGNSIAKSLSGRAGDSSGASIGASIGSVVGSALGPLGSALGGILGGFGGSFLSRSRSSKSKSDDEEVIENGVSAALTRTNKQLEIANRNLVDLKVSRNLYALPSSAFFSASGLPHFQDGGVVPGPANKPTLAVLHGQETVLPAGQRVVSIQNLNVGDSAKASDVIEAINQAFSLDRSRGFTRV